jgi:hypothetical protein
MGGRKEGGICFFHQRQPFIDTQFSIMTWLGLTVVYVFSALPYGWEEAYTADGMKYYIK